jgi:hypothetical protein
MVVTSILLAGLVLGGWGFGDMLYMMEDGR